jgi:hypothetical protein
VLGGFVAFLRWGAKAREKEFASLAQLKETIAARARAATTQGKRMDLFVYYQSRLSNNRFAHIIRQIQGATLHLISFLCLVVWELKQSDAIYYTEKLWPLPQFLRDYYHYIVPIELLVLLGLNVGIRLKLAKESKQLTESANGLTDELETFLA